MNLSLKNLSKNIITNQCIRLVKELENFSKVRPVKEVKKSLIGLISTLGNIKSVKFYNIYANFYFFWKRRQATFKLS
jgi:hypothetical protein